MSSSSRNPAGAHTPDLEVDNNAGTSLPNYYRLLRRNVHFRRLWLAQLVSGTGDWFYSVAIYDLIHQLTGSAEAVALAAVLQILPMFFIGPTAGAVNDRVSRRRVMLIADLVRSAVVLGMLTVESYEQIWLLYLLLALEVSTAAFFESARNAILPNVVARNDITTANAVAATTWSVTVTAGAAIGGFVVAWFGRETVFVLNSSSFFLSAWFIYRMRAKETHVDPEAPLLWHEILGFGSVVEGFRYVARDMKLASLLTLKFGLGILGARLVLVSVIGSNEFAVGGQPALGMSLLLVFQGIGSLVGPLLAGPIVGGSRARMRWGILVGYASAAVSYMAFSQAYSLEMAALTMVIAHAGGTLVWVYSTTLLHLTTEDRFRGRVFAADLALFMVTASVASYSCGWAIDHAIAARTAALGVGIALLLPAAAWMFSLRTLWRAGPEPR